MTASMDIIDRLAGITPGSRLDALRSRRPQARENTQNSYLALFAPLRVEGLSRVERLAVATFVAGLHGRDRMQTFYAGELAEAGDTRGDIVAQEIAAGVTAGPYGAYPAGPLSSEDQPGLHYRVSVDGRARLGERLSAAFEHAHLLVFRPRDASPAAVQALLDVGLSTNEIVTLSQLVAFLTFQIRVVAGLETLATAGEP